MIEKAHRDVDDINDIIGQFPRVVGSQIVAAALDEQEVAAELGLERLQGAEVGGDVFPYGGVRAAARLDGQNAGRRQSAVGDEEFLVLAREDVVRHGGWMGEIYII